MGTKKKKDIHNEKQNPHPASRVPRSALSVKRSAFRVKRSAFRVKRSALSVPPNNWQFSWQIRSFKIKLLSGVLVLLAILVYFPFFFSEIENRNGFQLPDMLLNRIPPHDVSLPVFLLIWASCLLLIIRLIKDPDLLLLTLWGYNLLTALRMICIGLISLDPPNGLIPLSDPLTNLFYGSHYITHDLFFSGHTATVCLIFFCLKRKGDKYFTGLATLFIGMLLLVQHVHYTVDVLAAPLFTYGVYRYARLFTRKEHRLLTSA